MHPVIQALAEKFFLFGDIPEGAYTGSYSVTLILLSFTIAVLGSYTGIRLAGDIHRATSLHQKRLLHIFGALSFGAGIWSMHFIGMLSYKMEMQMTYDLPLTGLSMLIATAVAYAALFVAYHDTLRFRAVLFAALLLGFAICGMHYTGMAAMDMDADIRYIPALFALSALIAVSASAAALVLIFKLRHMPQSGLFFWQVLAALVMGFAICGMHYTGMAATVMIPWADCRYTPYEAQDALILLIVMISGALFAVALTLSFFGNPAATADSGPDALPALAYSGRTVFLHLLALTSAFMILMTGSYLFLSTRMHDQAYESRLMNAVTLQRMLIARYTYYVSLDLTDRQARSPDVAEMHLEEIGRNAALIDQNFLAFAEGGKIVFSADGQRQADFGGFVNQQVLAAFAKSQTAWMSLRTLANDSLSASAAPNAEARSLLEKKMNATIQAQDEAVRVAQQFQEDNYAELSRAQQGALGAGLILFILALIYAKYFVAQPLDHARRALDNNRRNLSQLVRERTEEFRIAKEEAEKANSAKSDFLASMSHELRTPLNSILGLSRMLAEDAKLSPDHRGMSDVIRKSATALLNIVNDILDISKIESGKMTLEHVSFDFQTALTGTLETLKPLADAKGLSLDYTFDDEAINMPCIKGDPLRVGRILNNLIGNAVRYTEKGTVNIEVSFRFLGDRTLELSCAVHDTGIGIAADKLEMIFQRFTQADQSNTRKYGGTGLGLAITKDLVEMMGGTIGVNSTPGEGSTFWFKVPFYIAESLPTAGKEKPAVTHLPAATRVPVEIARILVAEDHPLNQIFMVRLLDKMGIRHVDLVENGRDALAKLCSGDYDLVLMDCHMPEMNGYDATRAIRALPGSEGQIPVIALTADAMPGTREKCLAAGMDEYISKPVDADDLEDLLRLWLLFPTEKKAAAANPPLPDGKFFSPADGPEVDMGVLNAYVSTPGELAEYIGIYVQQAQQDLARLPAACTDGENMDWVETTHRMKGGAGMAGARRLQALCTHAQQMNPATAEERRSMLAGITAALASAEDYLMSQVQTQAQAEEPPDAAA